MILTLGDLMSRSTEMAGGRTDWSPSDVSFYANLAYQDVIGLSRFRGEEAFGVQSTVSGEDKYALPTDFDWEHTIMLQWPASNSTSTLVPSTQTVTRVLMKRNPLQLDQLAWQDSAFSTYHAEYYTVYADHVQLWPRPSSADSIIMRYQTKPAMLMESTQTLAVDSRWHSAVLFKTVEYLEASRGDRQAEQVARNRFLSYVQSIPNDDALKQQARYGQAASFPREYFGGFGGFGGSTR